MRIEKNQVYILALLFLLLGNGFHLFAQKTFVLQGIVYDTNKKPLPFASIAIANTTEGTNANELGFFSLRINTSESIAVVVSFTGYQSQKIIINPLLDNLNRDFFLKSKNLKQVIITDDKRNGAMQRLNSDVAPLVTTASGDFLNAVLSAQPGVSMRNELSSSYSVRGGSFDENLVYVNDIEVYRPFLVRAGQQEGLSFVNSDLVSNVNFSSGGFDAKYGDKLSSVLDITYRKPTEFRGSFTAGLLGGSAHIEGITKNGKTSFITGIRYRSNAYLLGSLDEKGEYSPRYVDVQTYISHTFNKKWSLNFLGNYAVNRYAFVPQTRQTELGSIQQALRFTVYFDGQEQSRFKTGLGALDLNFRPSTNLRFKLIASDFATLEREEFDVVGQYFLDEIERDFGSDEFGKVVRNLGVGGYLNHARNRLSANVGNVNFKGYWDLGRNYLQFGTGIQREAIDDRLYEYVYIDSADYSLPQTSSNSGLLEVNENIRAKNSINSLRYSAYLQDALSFYTEKNHEFKINAGIRAQYWSLNKQTLVSPRLSLIYLPNWNKVLNDTTILKRNVAFRFSTGYYYQAPFYREMRNFSGVLNTNLQAQKSIHFVLGADYNLRLWERPFKLVGEAYYKILDKLVPYELENVRLRYYATNNAVGFARGADFKLNGEFVKGLESWASLSFLQTQEDLIDDYYVNYFNQNGTLITPSTFDKTAVDSVRVTPGYIPRPTDQRLSFGLFLQDEMPGFKGFKVNLSLIYGTGLPYGPPSFERYKDTIRTPSYRRVDIGFLKELIKPGETGKGFLKHFKQAYITLEVFNLLQINNTINYTWVRDVSGNQYAVPNFLTSRRVNLKIIARF